MTLHTYLMMKERIDIFEVIGKIGAINLMQLCENKGNFLEKTQLITNYLQFPLVNILS